MVTGCLAAAVYFAAACWLHIAFDPGGSRINPNVDGDKFLLKRPFQKFLDSNFAAIAIDPRFRLFADSADNNERSNVELYEDDKLLGPAHSVHRDIGTIGHGRYSHWRYNHSIFLFSSSDNTDPGTNGRNYWAVKRSER
jgi:hypothetical protein